ncbi:proteasome assembly chaperone-like protein isoform X2 [Wolffia australiana]
MSIIVSSGRRVIFLKSQICLRLCHIRCSSHHLFSLGDPYESKIGLHLPARGHLCCFLFVYLVKDWLQIFVLKFTSMEGHTFPVPHKSISSDINGTKTAIVISSYEDHFLVVVTQIGSMGTIIRARKEESFSTDPTFNVSVALGKRDEPLLIACARQLIEHISSGSPKHLMLSLGLKDHHPETVRAVASAVIDNRMW